MTDEGEEFYFFGHRTGIPKEAGPKIEAMARDRGFWFSHPSPEDERHFFRVNKGVTPAEKGELYRALAEAGFPYWTDEPEFNARA